jgi:hypothetical protein
MSVMVEYIDTILVWTVLYRTASEPQHCAPIHQLDPIVRFFALRASHQASGISSQFITRPAKLRPTSESIH